MFFGTLKVLLKDNVSTNYVADCSLPKLCQVGDITKKAEKWPVID